MEKGNEISYKRLLSDRLASALALRAKSKAELSQLTNIKAQTLTNISSGNNEASFSNVVKIAQALNLSLDYFASTTQIERDVHVKNESHRFSKIGSIATEIRLLSADDKRILFDFILPRILLELEEELKDQVKLIDWRKNNSIT